MDTMDRMVPPVPPGFLVVVVLATMVADLETAELAGLRLVSPLVPRAGLAGQGLSPGRMAFGLRAAPVEAGRRLGAGFLAFPERMASAERMEPVDVAGRGCAFRPTSSWSGATECPVFPGRMAAAAAAAVAAAR
jgi:hypothetical protein